VCSEEFDASDVGGVTRVSNGTERTKQLGSVSEAKDHMGKEAEGYLGKDVTSAWMVVISSEYLVSNDGQLPR